MAPGSGELGLNLDCTFKDVLSDRNPLVGERPTTSNIDVLLVVSRTVKHFQVDDGASGRLPGFDDRGQALPDQLVTHP